MIKQIQKPLLVFISSLLFFSCKSQNREIVEIENKEMINTIDTISFIMDENFFVSKNKFNNKFNKIYIPVQLKDSTNYTFLLDNCYTRTSIRDDIFNKMYDISNFRAVDTLSFTSSRVNFEGHIKIKMGEFNFLLDTLEIVNKERFEKQLSLTAEKGVIGFDLFEREIVEIDFDNYIVLIHSKLPEKAKDYLTFDLIYRKQPWKWNERMPRIQLEGFVNTNHEQLSGEFLFDLGKAISSLNSQFKSKLFLDISKYDTALWGYKLLCFTNAHKFDYGQAVSDNADLSESIENEHNQGTIGVDFLKHFNLIFDFSGGKLYLKHREKVLESPLLKYFK